MRGVPELTVRTERLVLELEAAVSVLRTGIAAGGVTVPAQRRLLRGFREAAHVVCELRGALEAYRACAMGRGLGVPLDLDARPLHVSDEDLVE
jgi:hypothetical protein